MRCCKDFLDVVSRRKSWDVRSLHQTELTRSLNLVELIGIGIGSCAGLGVFVMSAHVTKYESGPAVVLSVLVATLAALLSGLCHIELSTRLPRSGTGYTFCYVTLGELLAFVIGWSLLLENFLNGAIAAKAMWQYVGYMYNYTDGGNLTSFHVTSQPDIMETRPDFFPCCLVIAVIFLGFITIKRYAIVNFVLMSVSGLVVLAFICVGFFHVDSSNWNSPPGYFAFGFGGILSGSALMMSTYTSLDIMAGCAEETRTPCKTLPTAFAVSISVIFTILFLVTAALTLATPWQQLADTAALARAYESKGIYAANYVIGVGAVVGLLPVVIGSFLHPVRLLYSMSEDRLVPRVFGKVAYNGIPFAPHFICGLVIALCTLLLDFRALLEMSSITTLIQFIVSSIILLMVRFQPSTVGICREYSDLDILASALDDSALEIKDGLEFNESRPKLVLLANGDCKLQKDEAEYYSSIPDGKVLSNPVSYRETISSVDSKMDPSSLLAERGSTGTGSSLFVNSANSSPPSPYNSSISSSIKFVNRFKTLRQNGVTQPMGKEVYTESDGLFSQHKQIGNGKVLDTTIPIPKRSSYGVHDNSDYYGATDLERNYFRNSRHSAAESSENFNGTIRSVHSSVSSSLVAISPSTTLHADDHTWRHTRYFLLIYILSSTCLAATCVAWPEDATGSWWAVVLLSVSVILMLAAALCVARQPQNTTPLYFKAPYVPLVPLLAISFDMLLLASLPLISWARFAAWVFLGLVVYVCYSCRNSIHRQSDDQEVVLFDISQLPASKNSR